MEVNQGDIYWVSLDESSGLQPGVAHPHVIIQENIIDRSRTTKVVVCALTTNLKRAKAPGNVLLEEGEANLPKRSVVVVSQVFRVDEIRLGEYIGSLTQQRIKQILAGIQFLERMAAHHETGLDGRGLGE